MIRAENAPPLRVLGSEQRCPLHEGNTMRKLTIGLALLVVAGSAHAQSARMDPGFVLFRNWLIGRLELDYLFADGFE